MPNSEICDHLELTRANVTIALVNWSHDFNIASMVRAANAANIREVVQLSDSRKWDRRGAVGTHHYTPLRHFHDSYTLVENYSDHVVVCVDNNVQGKPCIPLDDYFWFRDTNYLVVFGSEADGIPTNILESAHDVVTIPQFGSVRSLNAACAASIVLYDYRSKTR